MNNSGFNNVFDIIEILAGIYVIYSGIKMKTTGSLSSQLVGKDIDLISPRDPQGFIKTMFPIDIICGCIFLVLGIISLIIDNFFDIPLWASLTITGILLVTCIVFASMTRVSQDKYLK